MRRIAIGFIFSLFIFSLFVNQSNAADTASVNVPSKWNVAVLNLKVADGVTAGEAEIISDRLRAELFNTGNVSIMEREEMKQILAEQGLQQSGACSDEACMVQTGKLLGVQQIIAGSIGKVGSMYLINLRMFDVSTGKLIRAISRDLNGIDVIVNNLPDISESLLNKEASSKNRAASGHAGSQPSPGASKPSSTAVPAAAQKKIGIRFSCNDLGENTILTLTSRTPTVTLNKSFSTVTRGPMVMPKAEMVVLVSRLVSFEAGIGYGMWKQVFTADTSRQSYTLTENYGMTSLIAGINLSIPVSTLRLYAGMEFGCDFLNNTEKATIASNGQTLDYAYYLVKTGVGGLTLSLKAGGEYMVSDHLGINFECLLSGADFSPAKLNFDPANSGVSDGAPENLGITVGTLGCDLGVTCYF